MARNSRWEAQARLNQDNQDSIKYARYENEASPRNVYYDKQPQRQMQHMHAPHEDESDYREMRYNRMNHDSMPSRAIQDYPLPLTLPVPLAVPPSLEYEPIIEEPIKSELILEDDWSNGLCDCCSDWGGCCFAFWCMPCFLCSFDKDSKECCCTTVGLGCCFGCGVCNSIMMQRAKIRGAYQINGSIFEDFCLTCFCCFCVLLQLHNEMRYRGDAM